MKQQIPEEIKSKRSDILFEDLAPMNRAFLEWHIGKEAEVLMEEKVSFGEKEYVLGHTKEYVKVAVDAEENLGNKLVTGRVKGILKEHILLLEGFSVENID